MRAGSFLGTADLAGRSLANPPILKVTKSGYRDTTYAMKASTDTTIQIVLADTIPTPPVSTTCKLPPSPAENGSGSFTNYWFGQGTWKENGYYQTACGYHGDEPSGQSSDKMNNLAFPQYFVAIPGNSSSDFNTNLMCGACVELTGQNGTKIVATVTDECPNDINAPCRANPNGHLDISYPGFSKLGFSVGNPTGTKWKYVICPVTGNVIFRSKPGNSNEFFIENTILPIKSVTISGTALTKTSYGAWHNGVNVSTKTLVITDYSDRSISYKVGTIAADQDVNTGLQFPACK